jgi:hypothetical protein
MMNFTELKDALKSLTFDSFRRDEDVYFEAVIVKSELEKMTAVLEKFFGPPAWTASKGKIPVLMSETIAEFGGVIAGQTLYFWTEGDVRIFAMLWPWQDREHITLKTGKK